MSTDSPLIQALSLRLWAAGLTIAVTGFVAGLKLWVALASGSVAMWAALGFSSLSLITALLLTQTLLAARKREARPSSSSALPAFSLRCVVVVGCVVIGGQALGKPIVLSHAEIGMAICLIAMFLNTLLISYQAWILSRTTVLRSPKDQISYKADLMVHTAVLSVFLASQVSEDPWLNGVLDGLVALGIGLYLAFGLPGEFRHWRRTTA